MQPVQTFMRLVDLPTTARTRWMLGFQRRLVRRWEWLRDLPNQGFLPQISQTDAITNPYHLNRPVYRPGPRTAQGYGAPEGDSNHRCIAA